MPQQNTELTEKDFPFSNQVEKEIKAKISKKQRNELLDNELEFDKEVQIFVMNQINKRNLTSNYVVGTLYKLAWVILHNDFEEQMRLMDELIKGGR